MALSTPIPAVALGGLDNPKSYAGTVGDLEMFIVPITDIVSKTPAASVRHQIDRIRPMREKIQREMIGAKLTNARNSLPKFINEMLDDNGDWHGPAWSVYVWLPERLVAPEGDGKGLAEYGLLRSNRGIMLDGESRCYAFERLIADETDPKRLDAIVSIPLNIVIYDGISEERASQHFRDLNSHGVGMTGSVLLAHDHRDPWMSVTKDVFKSLNIALETQSRQVKVNSDKVLTVVAARTMVAAVARGISAVQFGTNTIPEELADGKVDFERLEKAATAWLTHVFDVLGVDAFRDKQKVLRSTPVIAAIGAMGQPFYTGDSRGQLAAKAALQNVPDWTGGRRWNGIAGKMGANNNFSVGSGKELGYTAFRALTDPDDSAYKQLHAAARQPELNYEGSVE